MIRLLICDDSAEARSVVRTMLGDEAEIEVVGEAASGEEAVELSCAAFAATYLAAPDVALSLAGIAGGVAPDSLSSAPGVVIRAFSEAAPARADAREVAELYRLGNAAVGQAFAVPLCADGETLGALLVAMPASVVNELDEELIAAIADLA